LLFNEREASDNSEKVKVLEEQIEFLEGVIERLTTRRCYWTWTYTLTFRIVGQYTASGTASSGAVGALYANANAIGDSRTISVSSTNLVG
jgi:hypothetical protein